MDINNEDRDLPIPQTKKVFVYGTLKSDCCNNTVMQNLGAELLYKSNRLTENQLEHKEFISEWIE